MEKLNEPEWKHDLVKRIWVQARAIGYKDRLPYGLGILVMSLRNGCDRCGELPSRNNEVTRYQCCWVRTDIEDYCPQLCDKCHHELRRERPHETISV